MPDGVAGIGRSRGLATQPRACKASGQRGTCCRSTRTVCEDSDLATVLKRAQVSPPLEEAPSDAAMFPEEYRFATEDARAKDQRGRSRGVRLLLWTCMLALGPAVPGSPWSCKKGNLLSMPKMPMSKCKSRSLDVYICLLSACF